MNVKLTMVVDAIITFPDDFVGFGGKKPDDWTEDEMNIFKNDIAADFSIYDLGALNEKKSMVSGRRVTSFE